MSEDNNMIVMKIDEIWEELEKGIPLNLWLRDGEEAYRGIKRNTGKLIGLVLDGLEEISYSDARKIGILDILLGLQPMKNYLTKWMHNLEQDSQEQLDGYQWYMWFLCIQIQDWFIDKARVKGVSE